jgi:hypothetical protein
MTCGGQKTKDDKDNNNSGSSGSSTIKTIVINASCTISNAVDISNCKLDGSAVSLLDVCNLGIRN